MLAHLQQAAQQRLLIATTTAPAQMTDAILPQAAQTLRLPAMIMTHVPQMDAIM